jgi:hypothetical protein
MWVRPKAVTLPLRLEETVFCNQTIQVYSKDFIYYRSIEPAWHEAFGKGEHLIWDTEGRSHSAPVLDTIFDEVLHYRLPEGRMIG